MIEIPLKLIKFPKLAKNIKINKIPLNPKKLLTFPRNLQNDRNTLRTFNLTKIPLKHPKYPKPIFW